MPAGIPTHRIERKQRKPRCAGAYLDRLHQGASDSVPARPPVHEELGNVGTMRLIGRPRRVQRHAADDAEVVSRDQEDCARVGALERRPPPLPAASTENGRMKLTLAPLSTASARSCAS
jgi:hypothetical protein